MENQYCITKQQYETVRTTWKSTKTHTAAEHIIYNILRGKPATLGFVPRRNNIQGNDPWFACRNAIHLAALSCDFTNPWANSPHHNTQLHGEERAKARRERIQQTFGIDLPDDIQKRLSSIRCE